MPLAMSVAPAKPLCVVMFTKASMSPTTVPSSPMSGVTKAIVARMPRRRSRRGTSSWPASATMSFSSARVAWWRRIAEWMTRVTGVGVLAHSICASAKRRCSTRFASPRMNSPTRTVIR